MSDDPQESPILDDSIGSWLPSGFRWRTKDGEVLTLAEMKTGHIFNSLRSVLNRPAESPEERHRKNWMVALFSDEIARRGDLPERYKRAYAEIRKQIEGGLAK